MVRTKVAGHVEAPTFDVIVDLGHPLLNYTVDGFLKVGAVTPLIHLSYGHSRFVLISLDKVIKILPATCSSIVRVQMCRLSCAGLDVVRARLPGISQSFHRAA